MLLTYPAARQALTTSIPLLQCTSTSRINRNISSSPYRFRAITILLKITEISKNYGSVLGGRDTFTTVVFRLIRPRTLQLGPKASAIRRTTGRVYGFMRKGNSWGRVAQKRTGSDPNGVRTGYQFLDQVQLNICQSSPSSFSVYCPMTAQLHCRARS